MGKIDFGLFCHIFLERTVKIGFLVSDGFVNNLNVLQNWGGKKVNVKVWQGTRANGGTRVSMLPRYPQQQKTRFSQALPKVPQYVNIKSQESRMQVQVPQSVFKMDTPPTPTQIPQPEIPQQPQIVSVINRKANPPLPPQQPPPLPQELPLEMPRVPPQPGFQLAQPPVEPPPPQPTQVITLEEAVKMINDFVSNDLEDTPEEQPKTTTTEEPQKSEPNKVQTTQLTAFQKAILKNAGVTVIPDKIEKVDPSQPRIVMIFAEEKNTGPVQLFEVIDL